jgi:hypothetical protein
MSRVVNSFPPRGGKMTEAEPLLEELLDGKIHEFAWGVDWPEVTSPKEIRTRLITLGTQNGLKVKTAVRGDRVYAQIIEEDEEHG